MDIDNHLITLLFDYYEQFCVINGESYEEFDSRFIDNEGNQISELDYFLKHRKELSDVQLIDAVYTYLISEQDDMLDRIISYLLSHYYVFNYQNGSNPVIKYLRANDYDAIKEFFYSNYDFGIDLLSCYYKNIGNSKGFNANMSNIKENKDEEALKKFERIYSIQSVKSLSTIAREVVINLFNYYINEGASLSDALDGVWAYFLSDIDPLQDLQKIGVTDENKFFYKRIMLGYIIGDVYEDVCNYSVIKIRDEEDRVAQIVPIIITDLGIPAIPGDRETRNRLLNHFIVLQRLDDKKEENRKATYKSDRINTLKKVNPLYKLDELTF